MRGKYMPRKQRQDHMIIRKKIVTKKDLMYAVYDHPLNRWAYNYLFKQSRKRLNDLLHHYDTAYMSSKGDSK